MCIKDKTLANGQDCGNLNEGRFSFEDLRLQGLLYVDKTEHVYRMVKKSSSDFLFCSRPRRFGKSLMCSTLAYLFRGRRDLFEGLYISGTDYDFKAYPVIHLDFSALLTSTYEEFLKSFRFYLANEAAKNGMHVEPDAPSIMLANIILQSEAKIVLIIDEYDTPITRLVGDDRRSGLAEDIRVCLSNFFSTVKANSHRLRFFFLTGILRLSNLSIFSEMNNLKDISMDERYATAFGYTQEEVEEYFAHYIDSFMEAAGNPYRSRQNFLDAVKDYYDGYCFAYSLPDESDGEEAGEIEPHYSTIRADYVRANTVPTVYNPVALGAFFSNNCRFDAYWNFTDHSGLAVRLAQKHNLVTLGLDNIRVGLRSLVNFNMDGIMGDKVPPSRLYALLYYTGYLTIEEGDRTSILMRFPNQETAVDFNQGLCELCLEDESLTYSLSSAITSAVAKGDSGMLVAKIKEAFSSMPYDYLAKMQEKEYKSNLHMILKTSGISDLRCEEHGPFGRADNVLIHKGHIYCIEAKLDDSAEAGVRQAMERGYHLRHIHSGRKVHLLCLSFSSAVRNVESWDEALALSDTHFEYRQGERSGEVVEVIPVPYRK